MTSIDVDRAFASFAARGDSRALAAVYDALAPELLHVALRLARDGAEAEDLLQATFVTAIERSSSFRAGERVQPWLHGILAHHARNFARSRARTPRAERLPARTVETPLESASRAELDEALDRALAKFSDAFRPVLLLRLKHGLSAAEIADALGRAPGTVRSQLARGIEEVRRVLPASLAGSLVALLAQPTRGLDSIRAAVLAHGASHAAVPAVLSLAGALVLVKNSILAVALLALVLAAWRLSQHEPAPAAALELPAPVATDTSASDTSSARGAPDRSNMRSAAAEVASDTTSIPVPAPSAATTGALAVLVVDESDGRPRAGERVLAWPFGGDEPFRNERDATADESGVARFDPLPPGRVDVWGLSGGGTSGTIAAGRTLELRLAIPRGVDVAGEVVDESGAPVAHATIWCSERMMPWKGHVAATADAAGRFELRSVGSGRYLAAKSKHHALAYLQGVEGEPGSRTSLRIVLERSGARVAGRVVDPLGEPIAGAHVVVGFEHHGYDRILADGLAMPTTAPQRTRSQADGSFALDGIPLGRLPVQARANHHAPALVWHEIDAQGGELTLVLAPEALVHGTIRGAEGSPLAGVLLRAGPIATDEVVPLRVRGTVRPAVGDHNRFATSTTTSDADGRFELRGLAAGEVLVIAESAAEARASETFVLAAGARLEWNPILSTLPRIAGRVVDASGTPLAGFGVATSVDGTPRVPDRSAITDANGSFAIEADPDRTYALAVYRKDEWSSFPRRRFTGIAASAVEQRFVLDDEVTSATLTGTVVDTRGEPAGDASVTVFHEETATWRQYEPDSETGRFTIHDVPPGHLAIEVRSKDHPWINLGKREIDAGDEIDLGELRFGSSGRLRARLRGATDELVATLNTVLLGSQRKGTIGACERTGRELVSSSLAPGRYSVWLFGDGLADLHQDFEITADDETSIDVDLQEAGSRRVVVEVPEPLAAPTFVACTVLAADGKPICIRSAATNGERVRDLVLSAPPGTHRLIVSLGDRKERQEVPFTIVSTGRESDLHVRFEPR